jgi:hypothetical protein
MEKKNLALALELVRAMAEMEQKQRTESIAQRKGGYKTIQEIMKFDDEDVKDFKRIVLEQEPKVTLKELNLVRNKVVEKFFQDEVSDRERGLLRECFNMIIRLKIKDGINPYNVHRGKDDIMYPFIYSITDLLEMPKSEFENIKNTIILMLSALYEIRND